MNLLNRRIEVGFLKCSSHLVWRVAVGFLLQIESLLVYTEGLLSTIFEIFTLGFLQEGVAVALGNLTTSLYNLALTLGNDNRPLIELLFNKCLSLKLEL